MKKMILSRLKTNIIRFGLTLLVGLHCSGALAAGYVSNAHVVQVRVDRNGYGMVRFDQLLNSPTCGNNIAVSPAYGDSLAFDTSTVGGKNLMALALLTKATGTPLYVAYGAGTCTIYGDGTVEDWSYAQ